MATSRRLLRWGSHYELGNRELDHQHEDLIHLLNSLSAQWREGAPRTELSASLRRLIASVRTHFRTEEQLMSRHRYAQRDLHKREHDSFVAEIRAFHRDFDAGRASLDEDTFRHFADWLRNHLLISDQSMGEALRKKGAKSFQ